MRHLIRLSLASGVDTLQMKERLFGTQWLGGNMGRKEMGVLARSRRGMELGCGKQLESQSISWALDFPLWWEMVRGWVFGRISGVELDLVWIFPLFICPSCIQRGLGKRCLGSKRRKGEGVRALISLGLSMIGRWMRWKDCYYVWGGRRWIWMRIGWGGWNRRMIIYRQSPFTKP